jgi:predicted DNA-binding transcriptional regulator AlpA
VQKLLTFESLVELGYVSNRVTLSRRIRRGEFPAPIHVGSRNLAWLKSEIDAWEAEQIARRDHMRHRTAHVA